MLVYQRVYCIKLSLATMATIEKKRERPFQRGEPSKKHHPLRQNAEDIFAELFQPQPRWGQGQELLSPGVNKK